jgi:long-chain fatty acid transport protein
MVQGGIMKKILFLLFILGILILSTEVFAGSIDYLSNQSAEYFITLNRNAATDAADIANYNPAGTVFLPQNGLYLDTSVQYLFKPYNQTFRGATYKQDEPSIIPNIYAVYKKDPWAGFFAITIPAGGGKVKWNKGDATTAGLILQTAAGAAALAGGTGATTINSQRINISSEYVGFTLGGASKINDTISLSLAGRYIISQRNAHASANFAMDAIGAVPGNETNVVVDSKFDYNARGFGGIIGLDIKPIKELLIGIRYETVTKLWYRYETKSRKATVSGPVGAINAGVSNNLLTQLAAFDNNGRKIRNDLPALLGLGINYTVMPGFDVMSSFNYYFLKEANLKASNGDYKENGWEAGLGATYKVLPILKIGLGFLNTESGETDSTPFVTENAHLNSRTVGLGATYTAMPNLDLTLAGARTKYLGDSNNEGTVNAVRFEKIVNTIALGVQYRFDM